VSEPPHDQAASENVPSKTKAEILKDGDRLVLKITMPVETHELVETDPVLPYMKYKLDVQQFRGSVLGSTKVDVGNRILRYLRLTGDQQTQGDDWDYRILLTESYGRLAQQEAPIEWPWTYKVTAMDPWSLDIRWREEGDYVEDRGTTQNFEGVTIELERFLLYRRRFRLPGASEGHVFISYVTDDSELVDRLQADLEGNGIAVWRDRTSLGSGERWKDAIRHAIQSGTFFVCCFSEASKARNRSYMNEELTVAVEELRARPRRTLWFLPVVLPGGEVPDWPVGGGENLRDFHYTMLEPATWAEGMRRLARAIRQA
jgi:hypothetical protein